LALTRLGGFQGKNGVWGTPLAERAVAPPFAAVQPLNFRPAGLADAAAVHRIYQATPEYFEVLSFPTPSLGECATEISLALTDPNREVTLIEADGQPVGLLDVKLSFPGERDATVNLLLIAGPWQGLGLGTAAMRWLEKSLQGRSDRVLAGIYLQNTRAARFYENLGYRFSHAALPVMNWYAKSLSEA